VTVQHGRPYVDILVSRGLVKRADGVLRLTPAGSAAADQVFRARRQGLAQLLAGWSPEEHADLAHLLDRLSHALLGDDADRRLVTAASATAVAPGPAG